MIRLLVKARRRPIPLRSGVNAIADNARAIVVRSVVDAFLSIRNRTNTKRLIEALATGSVERVVAAVGMDAAATKLIRSEFREVRAALRGVVQDTGRATTASLERVLKPKIGMSFDLLNPKTVDHLRTYDLRLIQGITDKTREGIRAVITDAFKEGGHPYEQARKIKPLIGLRPNQAEAVQRYREMLQTEDRAPAQVQRMVERYADRQLTARAENIARTETIRASTEGRHAAWDQATEEGLLLPGTKKQWVITPDDRLCPLCEAIPKLNPGGVHLAAAFKTPEGGIDGPPLHPQCRCTTILLIDR